MQRIEFQQKGKTGHIQIFEAIDEFSKFPEVSGLEELVVDFDGLTRLNSVGIRIWLVWIGSLKGVRTMHLENCRPRFIDQTVFIADMVPPFAQVKSFYVPFFDEESGKSKEVKLVYGVDYDSRKLTLPQVVSDQGQPMELDVNDAYFRFLKIHP